MYKKSQQNKMAGLTFVEVLVWVGVIVMLMSAMTLAIIQVYKSNSYSLQRVVGIISARRGLEEVVQLVRKATYSDAGAYPIVAFADNELTFYVDYDNDDSAELVRIFLDNEDLNMGIIEAQGTPAVYNGAESIKTITDNIRNIALSKKLFTYYGDDGLEVIDQSAVLEPTYIDLIVVANTGKNPQVDDYEIRGSAFMRNLKN